MTVTSSEELHAQTHKQKEQRKQRREEKAASSGGAENDPELLMMFLSVYYNIGERLELEGETENNGV